MRLPLILALLVSARLFAQQPVDPVKAQEAITVLERESAEHRLLSDVYAARPTLNYSFRFQAGYCFRVPMKQYAGKGHAWKVITRITPPSGNHLYLAAFHRLPAIPEKTKVEFGIGGSYLLGEGDFQVDWYLVDDLNRVCAKKWRV